ncbi:MAG: quinone-dependent dihydroorotate dehydrogenase [Saprospiraceae bacterium]|nr:quinone-dependent dihydroorotate dehydrogenase [Saprospiraceae bacterium]
MLKPLLFLLPPEKAHHLALKLFGFALSIPIINFLVRKTFERHNDAVTLAGITFPNRVGLAAGFDKDGKYMSLLKNLGFGFLEIGTVTPEPQEGNPRPRLFRLPEDEALINRMGFNNDGLQAMVERLRSSRPSDIVIGANIGKNKVTPNEHAVDDYIACFKALKDHVDYFVVNVSSPNTPGLRELQEKDPLMKIICSLQQINDAYEESKPIFLKIAPDLTNDQLDDIAEIVRATGISGIVATNTTISREGLTSSESRLKEIGNGGLSGKPVLERSNEVIAYLRKALGQDVVIIGVGGIFSASDAQLKINAGADLVQIYTGFIYEGPGLVGRIAANLEE